MEHKILVELQIADQKILHFESIKVTQAFNQHHKFEVVINHDIIESTGAYKIDQSQAWIGKTMILSIDNGALDFKGIVCEVMLDQGLGLRGNLIIRGFSPTILLETGRNLASYSYTTLSAIARQILSLLPANDLSSNVAPGYKEDLVYITQFKESNFAFLNRLSAEYGEYFYYDGTKLNFGKPDQQKEVKLVHGQNLNVMQMAVRIKPQNFSYYSYNSAENQTFNSSSSGNSDGLDYYGNNSIQQSAAIFSDKVNTPIKPRVTNKNQLDQLTTKHAAVAAADLSDIAGESINTSLNLGCVTNISVSRQVDIGTFDQNDLGKYLITEITHQIDGVGKYKNHFKGITAGVTAVPVENVVSPQAESQVGIVTENNDPKHMGRVKVQMLWQQNDQCTDWIRVLTPDAGSSGNFAQNRGQVFIPEVGDQVILGFRYNDPDRPFVMGSIFNGDTGAGGDIDNVKKTISTRSGHLIEFDDSDGKETITITDKSNNKIRLDTSASSIEITAPEYVRIRAKNIEIIADDDITITAGDNIMTSAGENITHNAGKDHLTTGENITMLANDNIQKTASHIEKTAEKINVNSTKDNIEMHSSKQIINKSGGKVKLF
jgi:type VI secretion system secreted protein VgrG